MRCTLTAELLLRVHQCFTLSAVFDFSMERSRFRSAIRRFCVILPLWGEAPFLCRWLRSPCRASALTEFEPYWKPRFKVGLVSLLLDVVVLAGLGSGLNAASSSFSGRCCVAVLVEASS